ncbi:hypothetical protein SYNTR_1157 [Candidatus Syntrophocurvum alkaliphilum]|uniref:Uncharacterized protein n=1 Tax=Candidatus Syntrophocurvum alkaliphilum TaxID=2293317 RepID=A0A6I6DHC1_9FIRM|nr:hypothetical protein [Candidatus Syntrophocurvum alkaliphilum]QGT99750.1 hypothetical protein SYNTR_1157 [Candidatus Syntrophocurvum alkaliphilum]
MSQNKPARVINVSKEYGHNKFLDTETGVEMSREEFLKKIENGEYPEYYIISKNGGVIPSSSPEADMNNLD